MNLQDWQSIPWLKKNEIIRFYKIRRTGQVRMRTIAPGIDTMDEDGIIGSDLDPIKDLTLEEVLSLTPIGQREELPIQTSLEPMAKPSKPRKPRKKK